MAGESIDPPLAPIKVGLTAASLSSLKKGRRVPASNDRRASIGYHHTQASSSRNSTGKSVIANGSESTVPHYLRASTGSCHDICKYGGGKHEFVEKPWKKKPVRKSTGTTLPYDLSFIEIKVSSEQKEKVIEAHLPKPKSKLKANSPRLKAVYVAKPNKSTSSAPPKFIKKEMLLARPLLLTDRGTSKTEKSTEHQSVKPSGTVKDKLIKVKQDDFKGETIRSDKTSGKIRAFRISAKKASSPRLLLSRTTSIEAKKYGNSKADQSKMTGAEISKTVFKKALHVIKIETASSATAPKVQIVKENYKNTPGKNSEDKYRSPVKLKFRSGKVIDLHLESDTPKRLKFRRPRVQAGEDGKSGGLNRSVFKNSGSKGERRDTELLSNKVVLKHRDVRGKRDARGLLNHVIEETASKLVEARKSKVKALVGAFETVISLQEIKVSSQSAN